jgi:hypothetical protein
MGYDAPGTKVRCNLLAPHPPPLFFSGEGPRSRRYGRTAALTLLVQEYGDEDEMKKMVIFCPFQVVEHRWNDTDRENRSTRGKTCPVPLRPQQIPHGLSRDRNGASAVGGRGLTA